MKLGVRNIGDGIKPYIIAELGSNHNGDMDLARRLIDEAALAGCDCIKFQSWTKDTIFSRKVYDANYFLADDYRNRSDYTLEEIVEKFSVSRDQLRSMKSYCVEKGVEFSCTPFSFPEVDFLVDELDVGFIKVASMDLNNYEFLRHISKKGRPVILSTGFGTLAEIDLAVETIEKENNQEIVLMHCVANYPPRDENVNLNNIDMLRNNYPAYSVGFSDHSVGVEIPLAAVAKGACVIEKHFTLDKDMFGWDHKVSAMPWEMKNIVTGSERIAKALGSYRRVLSSDDVERMPAYRRSIVAARDIPAGKTIERSDVDFKRPGGGFEPGCVNMVIGRIAKRDIRTDDVLQGDDF